HTEGPEPCGRRQESPSERPLRPLQLQVGLQEENPPRYVMPTLLTDPFSTGKAMLPQVAVQVPGFRRHLVDRSVLTAAGQPILKLIIRDLSGHEVPEQLRHYSLLS